MYHEYPKWVNGKDGKPVVVDSLEEELKVTGKEVSASISYDPTIKEIDAMDALDSVFGIPTKPKEHFIPQPARGRGRPRKNL